MLCSTFKLEAWTDDEMKLKLFSFSLKGKAKDWLRSKPVGDFKSWKGIADAFLKYYHSQKKIYMRRFNIMTFKQTHDENLIPTIERFLKLLHDCPFHNLSDCVLLHIFYGGLNDSSRINLDIICDGSFYDKTFEESWNL